MNIRTKLALALVTASLASMAALGYFAYVFSSELLTEISLRQLDALAEGRKDDLAKVLEGWRENVRLVRSRTRLRELLLDAGHRTDPEQLGELRRIARDVERSSQSIRRITLFDADGEPIVVAGHSAVPPEGRPVEGDAVDFRGLHLEDDETLGVVFHSNVERAGELIGRLEIVFRVEAVRGLSDDFTGLGATGETYVVAATPADHFLVLDSLRHDAGFSLRTGPLSEAPPAAMAAIEGREIRAAEGVRDYRGTRVIAATRSLPELGWGIVVKIDAAEVEARAHELLDSLIDLGLAIGALTILCGTLLGFRLARPIRDLAHVVDLARNGDADVRAATRGDDEVAFLARSINDLLDQTRELSERKPD